MKKYEQIDHTADIGLRIFGKNLEDLIANAGYALCNTLTDLTKVNPEAKDTFSIKMKFPSIF